MVRAFPLQALAFTALGLFATRMVEAQTLVVNELSNGPSGTKEYVEMVVVPTAPANPCEPPPCLDLRRWIVDDNNNYHGTGGAAAGALRFSNHALWSCVPQGTVILIYNNQDRNAAVPATDIDPNDGNFRLVMPVSQPGYFEESNVTPNAALCALPGNWIPATNTAWTTIGLRNEGDCIRICEPDGCEVFSLCYGSNRANATVHMPGTGSQRVWSFSDGSPGNAANWRTGNAGTSDETPGAPNNAANAAWISTLNNNGEPWPGGDLELSVTHYATCGCTSSATASVSTNIPGVVYTWYNANWTQRSAGAPSATDLCSGTYHVIAALSPSCRDTVTFTISEQPGADAGPDVELVLCLGSDAVDPRTHTGGTPIQGAFWSPTLGNTDLFDPAIEGVYSYSYVVPGAMDCPADTALYTITVPPPASVQPVGVPPLCPGAANGSMDLGTTQNVVWDDGSTGPVRNDLSAGVAYGYTITDQYGCNTLGSVVLQDPEAITYSVTVEEPRCAGGQGRACVTLSNAVAPILWAWSTGSDSACTPAEAGTISFNYTDANGCSGSGSAVITGNVEPLPVVTVGEGPACHGENNGWLRVLSPSTGLPPFQWTAPDGSLLVGDSLGDLVAGVYTGEMTDPDGCVLSARIELIEPPLLTLTLSITAETCSDRCDGGLTLIIAGGTAPYSSWVDNEALPGLDDRDLCAGLHEVRVSDAHGCTAASTVDIQEGGDPVDVVFITRPELCTNDEPIRLLATPGGGSWSGRGIVDPANGLFDPAESGAGTWEVHYTPANSACVHASSLLIPVHGAPVATWSERPAVDGSIELTADAVGGSTVWEVDGQHRTDNPSFRFLPAGPGSAHLICLSVRNAHCFARHCATLIDASEHELFVPNAFTPNNDGLNDGFLPLFGGGWSVGTELVIFDRWGSILYRTTEPIAWTGSAQNGPVPHGVYPWRLSWRTQGHAEPKVRIGHVTLVR